jgi:TonB family protein
MGGKGVSNSYYYRWQVPGKPVAVSLSLAVVEQLGLAVRTPEESPSRRLPEIGGLLSGTVKRTRGLTVVEVGDFECVECEHVSGPSYFLSSDDQRRLKERIRRRKRAGGRSLVGFFRSNTRREFEATVEDLDLMDRFFAKDSMVLLLVHAGLDGALRGGFLIREQQAIRTMTPYLEFPFDSGALPGGNYEIERRPGESPAGNVPRLPAGLTSVPAVPFRMQWLAATAALAVAIGGGALYRGSGSAAAPPTVAPISSAGADRATEEVVAPQIPVAAIVAENIPALPERPPAAAPAPPSETVADHTREAPKPFMPVSTPQAPDVESVPSVPDPPNVALEPVRIPVPVFEESAIPPSPVPARPDPFVSIVVDAPPSERRGLLGRVSRKTHSGQAFVPPRPIDQPSPQVPPELRSRIAKPVPITVKLYVGRSGSVEYAELLSDGTGANRDLASLAVFTARKWRFSPAQEGGEAVPAQVRVQFRFGADAAR